MRETTYRKLNAGGVVDRLLTADRWLILFHVRPDSDAVGSAFALRRLLEHVGERAYCVCADEVPERLKFITQGIQDSVSPESVPADMREAPVLSVDSASPNQLGRLYEIYGDRLQLMIDHHGRGTQYADGLIIPDAAATAEVLSHVINEMKNRGLIHWGADHPYSCEVAMPLYAGLAGDTGCFHFSNTTGNTFRFAGDLRDSGVDTAEINRVLFEIKTDKLMLAEHVGYELLEKYYDGRVALIVFPKAKSDELHLSADDMETLVDIARCPVGVEVAIVAKESEPGIWRISARSNCDIDVSAFCAVFGGGGHVRAAGATIEGQSGQDIKQMLVTTIQNYI